MRNKLFTVALTALLGVALATPATAAVESVRVGGDLTIRGIYRDNLDFIDDLAGGQSSDAWYMTTTRLWVGAELTDNVSALVRILNEREWDTELGTGENEMSLDLAYIRIGDLFVPGLTATLGRQEIVLGDGFVVGSRNSRVLANYLGILTQGLPVPSVLPGLMGAVDLSERKAFDALRFDYEVGTAPVDVTLFGAKIGEHGLYVNNDADLWGLNVAYTLDQAVVEGYLLSLKNRLVVDNLPLVGPVNFDHRQDIWTIGARLDHEWISVPGLAWDAEVAHQFGDVTLGGDELDQRAWAANIDLNFSIANPYEPKIGAAYAYYSGDDGAMSPDLNKGFFSMFPGNQGSRVGKLWNAVNMNNDPLGLIHGGNLATNLHAFKVYGAISPAEGHVLSAAVFPGHRLDQAAPGDSKDLGWGVDVCWNLQYTEDVTLGLDLGYLRAGDAIGDDIGGDFDKTAYQVIGSVSLSF